MNFWKLWNQ